MHWKHRVNSTRQLIAIYIKESNLISDIKLGKLNLTWAIRETHNIKLVKSLFSTIKNSEIV